METKTKTVTVEITYKVFDVGDRVRASSFRSTLGPGVWTVSKYCEPYLPYITDGTVFVDGQRYGLSAEYLKLAEE